MTSNDKETSGEVAVVADKVETAAAVEIAAASKEKLDEMEKLKRSGWIWQAVWIAPSLTRRQPCTILRYSLVVNILLDYEDFVSL